MIEIFMNHQEVFDKNDSSCINLWCFSHNKIRKQLSKKSYCFFGGEGKLDTVLNTVRKDLELSYDEDTSTPLTSCEVSSYNRENRNLIQKFKNQKKRESIC